MNRILISTEIHSNWARYQAEIHRSLRQLEPQGCKNHSDWGHTLCLWVGALQLYEGMKIVFKGFVDRRITSLTINVQVHTPWMPGSFLLRV